MATETGWVPKREGERLEISEKEIPWEMMTKIIKNNIKITLSASGSSGLSWTLLEPACLIATWQGIFWTFLLTDGHHELNTPEGSSSIYILQDNSLSKRWEQKNAASVR